MGSMTSSTEGSIVLKWRRCRPCARQLAEHIETDVNGSVERSRSLSSSEVVAAPGRATEVVGSRDRTVSGFPPDASGIAVETSLAARILPAITDDQLTTTQSSILTN